MKNSITFFVFWCLATITYSQNNITGTVLSPEGNPLEFVNTLLIEPSDSQLVRGAISDVEGVFLLEDVAAGSYLLQIQFLGYADHFETVQVQGSKAELRLPAIVLRESANKLSAVTVTAKRPLLEQKMDRTIVNVENSVTAAGGNALEILERSPGVRVDGISGSIALDGESGVIIQINGKRSRLDGDALLQFLRSMPASNIAKIELITTPPANYDAEGSGGIINIVLRQKQDDGTYGNINLFTGYGTRGKFGGSASLDIRKGRFNIFSSFSSNDDYKTEDVSLRSAIQSPDGLFSTSAYSNRPAHSGSYNGRLGVDFEISERTTVGVLFSGFSNTWDLDADTKTSVLLDGAPFTTSDLRSREKNDWTHWMGNINFAHEFRNKLKWTFDYDYLNYQNENPADYLETIRSSDGELMETREFFSRKDNPIEIHVVKMDFSNPLGEKGKLEYGVKLSTSSFANDNALADIINGEPEFRPLFTNLLNLDENIGAIYVSGDYQLTEKTGLKMGLRYEYTDLALTEMGETLVSRKYGRLFPSFFLSHQFNDDNSVRLTYSERIQRPSLGMLAPAFFFFSPNNLLAGNPAVQAAFTKKLSLSYIYKRLTVSINGVDVNRPIVWGQVSVLPDENLSINRPENINDIKRAFATVNYSQPITKWWESQYEFWAGYNYNEVLQEGRSIVQDAFFYGFYSNQSISLPKKLTFVVDGYLESPWAYGLSRTPLRGSFNVGLQKKIGDQHQITLNYSDVLDLGSFWEFEVNQPDINVVYFQRYDAEGSVVRLTWNYSFGKKAAQRKRQHDGGSSDERNRVN